MNKNHFPLIFAAGFIAMFSFSSSAVAEEADVLPPPTTIHDTEEARETIVSDEGETDLNEELAAPDNSDQDGAEVRSFTRGDGAEITEYAVNGKVYMIRVQPAGKFPAYYLYDRDGDGAFEQRLPGGYKRPNPPMWVIKKF